MKLPKIEVMEKELNMLEILKIRTTQTKLVNLFIQSLQNAFADKMRIFFFGIRQQKPSVKRLVSSIVPVFSFSKFELLVAVELLYFELQF